MIKMVEINDSQFNSIVLKSALPVLLECASPECIICKTMSERIHEAGKDYTSKMIFLRLNINDNKRWKDFNVRVIPTLLYFKNGVLVARQENFPDIDEIHAKIKTLMKKDPETNQVQLDFKTALDLENVAAKFYKYVCANVKNGQVRERFRKIYLESLAHTELLQLKLRELTGELYTPLVTGGFEDVDMKPQVFSLYGAFKVAAKIEGKLLLFHKKILKNKLMADRGLFKKLADEESRHLKEIQREMRFAQDKELFSPVKVSEQSPWFDKILE